jgi:hypothetical protein
MYYALSGQSNDRIDLGRFSLARAKGVTLRWPLDAETLDIGVGNKRK